MQLFQINAMNVSRDKFKLELEKNGLKYGYIPRLYEKFKQGEMTCFRLVIKDYQFVVVTDDESSYPEIQEETGKKAEPYSFEWLVDTVYDAELAGPVSYEVLLRQLQRYIQIQKAIHNDEKKEQENCPYCHKEKGSLTPRFFECNYDRANAWIELDDKVITFDNADGDFTNGEFKIDYCPKCGRELEVKS